ncbi:LxmA leader domain family RiPP [Streptomyces sp. NPDC096176]|uniref:LxmA leader domain family RiPP n=1 Tax=unclassified Streptomyces TaxID=2593676 RepID=UPI001BEB81EC|nr:LxmA leader domain family RiPP [Streptomyces sp. ISL-10]MBT2365134.1 LxmA leader domain family RiPP [Streptomyces sp. ISL-10]
MNTADQLLAGYTAYTTAEDFGASADNQSPAATPTITTVSSPECIYFSLGASAGSIASTKAWGC